MNGETQKNANLLNAFVLETAAKLSGDWKRGYVLDNTSFNSFLRFPGIPKDYRC